MSSASVVQNLALKLPRRSRLKLASELLHSMVPTATPEEALGAAARRDADIETGKVKPLSEAEFWSGIAERRSRA